MKDISYKKGFTLVETLLAVGILTLSVFGAFTAVQNGLSASIHSKEEVTAFYLAEEAVEKIRNVRDANALNPNNTSSNWLDGIITGANAPCANGDKCKVDAIANTITSCPLQGATYVCPPLKQDSASGFYQYSTGADSIYTRDISISRKSSNGLDEVQMTVDVTWTKGVLTQKFEVKENLLNWQ